MAQFMEQNIAEERQEVVVVVDPYSSGKYVVQELLEQHWEIVAVRSSLDLDPAWLRQLDRENFVDVVTYESLEQTVAELSKFEVKAVIPGSEPGVMLAEDLQEELKIEKRNGNATKEWRRHKFDMQERLRECGIRAIRQIFSNSVDEVLEWQRIENHGKWPIIVKPAMSGGTDGVYWCQCAEDVKVAYAEECGKINVNGQLNDKLLAQEFLDGIEYVVDCTSNGEGRHITQSLWEYTKFHDKETRAITYGCVSLMTSRGEVQDQIVPYVHKCLDALGIKFGASHSEVIMCHDGPCLVETGARMHGFKGPFITQLGTGLGLHELAVDVHVNEGRLFDELYASGFHYMRKKFVVDQKLRNTKVQGVLTKDIDGDDMISNLKSVIAVHPKLKKGDRLELTRDLASSAGNFLQVYPTWEQCEKDAAVVREAEMNGEFYQVEVNEVAAEPKTPTQDENKNKTTLEKMENTTPGKTPVEKRAPAQLLSTSPKSSPKGSPLSPKSGVSTARSLINAVGSALL